MHPRRNGNKSCQIGFNREIGAAQAPTITDVPARDKARKAYNRPVPPVRARSLAQIFHDHAPQGLPRPGSDREALEPVLARLWKAGCEAWPAVPLPAETFAAHLGRHLPAGADPATGLWALCLEDLFLACACAHGLPQSLLAFERGYLEQASAFLPGGPSDHADEVRQLLRERLLAPRADAPPRIAEYAGRGSLLSWVRTAAVRTSMSLLRKPRAVSAREEDAALADRSVENEAELDYIRGRYRDEFRQAFQEALAALSVQQRNLLRLYYLDGLSDARSAAVLGVSRSTVKRRLADARSAIVREVHRLLHQRLRLAPAELDSLAGVLRSQLDVSLARLLSSVT